MSTVDRTFLFLSLCTAHKLPTPTPEFRFDQKRRWRFDYCWPDYKIALEIEGGVWVRGRHSRGAGMVKDMEKYNAAVLAGWRLLRCTPQQVESGEVFELLREAMVP